MQDLKLWVDLAAAAMLVFIGIKVDVTGGIPSYLVFRFFPIILAFLLAMSQARALF